MSEFTYRAPTDAEMTAIRARAHKLRAEATREMFAAIGHGLARAWAWIVKPAGWRIGAN